MMRGFCPEGAYVLMELCMEGVLSEGVLSEGVLSEGFCPTFIFYVAYDKTCSINSNLWLC